MNTTDINLKVKKSHRLRVKIEGKIIHFLVACAALATLLVTFSIIWNLAQQSIGFFSEVSIVEFFSSTFKSVHTKRLGF